MKEPGGRGGKKKERERGKKLDRNWIEMGRGWCLGVARQGVYLGEEGDPNILDYFCSGRRRRSWHCQGNLMVCYPCCQWKISERDKGAVKGTIPQK